MESNLLKLATTMGIMVSQIVSLERKYPGLKEAEDLLVKAIEVVSKV